MSDRIRNWILFGVALLGLGSTGLVWYTSTEVFQQLAPIQTQQALTIQTLRQLTSRLEAHEGLAAHPEAALALQELQVRYEHLARDIERLQSEN